MTKFNNGWDDFFESETKKLYYIELRKNLKEEYTDQTIFPPAKDIFNAFKYTGLNDVKVVILGQDPYHGENQAMGLSFSVNDNVKIPPSLVNIYKEIKSDIGEVDNSTGNLIRWANQGVFLLNTTLTVRKGFANSHLNIGWTTFTDNVIKCLNEDNNPKVFMLWGKNARDKSEFITNPKHLILEAAHPSPLSAHNGFFGCKHFSKANEFLTGNNITSINWK